MARLVIEDVVFYMIAFYLITSIIFQIAPFNTFFPNQQWNNTAKSFEPSNPAISQAPSIYTDMTEVNNTLNQYNDTSILNPSSLLDPVGIVGMVGKYIGLITGILSCTMLSYILTAFVGAELSHTLTLIFNICIIVVGIRVLSGRIRWD